MYLDYFGLEKEPFSISPDPAFLYPSPQHRQALAHLKYGLEREGGFILLTGEVGTGKTTLTRLLLEQLPGNIRVAYILNTRLDSEDVLASICQDLGLAYEPGASIKTLTDSIYKDLLGTHGQGRKTLLVLEEAQNLDFDVLETLRLLTNLETNTAKLLHILLVGQPELQELLGRSGLRQLNQRVVSRFHIEPLDLRETSRYLNHRMRHAGGKRQAFDAASIKQLYRLSGGIPRMLNLLAERSLLGAFSTSESLVSPRIVKTASQEVLGAPVRSSNNGEGLFPGMGLLLRFAVAVALTVTAVYYFLSPDPVQQTELAEQPVSVKEPVAAEPVIDLEKTTSVPVQPPAKAIMPPSDKNTYEQLLGYWSVDATAANQKSLCLAAERNGMRCKIEKNIEMGDLLEINRPGLVALPGDRDLMSLYIVRFFDGNNITLANSSGRVAMSAVDFADLWDGGYVYIWRPPSGFARTLHPGVRDAEMTRWVQEKLAIVFDNYEYVINGGAYSQPIVRAVARFQSQQGLEADGLLGSRTMLRLMDQTEELPRLDRPRESVGHKRSRP